MAKQATKRRPKTRAANGNKSELIRQFFNENPSARPRDAVEALRAKGHEVSPALVSNTRTRMGVSKGRPGRRKTSGKQQRRSSGSVGNGLSEAIIFVSSCGSLNEAKRLLGQLEGLKRLL